ncbi:MAG: ATPase [Chitinophagaceae bacterium]|jgi:uncharacterized protein YndB with AHSA1/START domain|nr:MAG: ATPase [Chitinophagaceae bacterium]
MEGLAGLTIKTKIRILKPAGQVYEAIVDPQKMSHYFISKGSGRMESGKDLIWRFPEFDMDVPISVQNTVADQYISYYWDERDKKHLVEITLEADGSYATIVSVSEGGEDNDEAGIGWLQRNTEGWANFLACLKAYLEYGINLRKGAFDFLKK